MNCLVKSVLLIAASCPMFACANGAEADLEETATAAQPLRYSAKAVGCTGSYINIISTDGYYCTAEGGGGGDMTCNRTAAGEWERFRVVDMGTDGSGNRMLALETSDTIHYVCAEEGGGSSLVANRTVPGAWETFYSPYAGNGAPRNFRAFQTQNGHYAVAEGGGGDVMNADRTAIGPWETFLVDCLD